MTARCPSCTRFEVLNAHHGVCNRCLLRAKRLVLVPESHLRGVPEPLKRLAAAFRRAHRAQAGRAL